MTTVSSEGRQEWRTSSSMVLGRFNDWASDARVVIAILIPTTCMLGAIWLQPWVLSQRLLVDPLVAAQESIASAEPCCSSYLGLVSNVGVGLWVATAAIALFAAALINRRGAIYSTRVLLTAGLFTLWLGLDDLFLFHESAIPELGVPEKVCVAAYAALAVAYLGFAFRAILSYRPLLFAAAVLFLAGSAIFDLIGGYRFFEDSLKYCGIALWSAYHIGMSFSTMRALDARDRTNGRSCFQ